MCLLWSTMIDIHLNDNDGIFEIPSEPPGLGSIPDELIVMETWSDPLGLGLIPSKPLLSSLIDDGVGTAPAGGEQCKKI